MNVIANLLCILNTFSMCTFAFWCTILCYMNPIREIENNGSGNEIISFDWVTMDYVSSTTLKRC